MNSALISIIGGLFTVLGIWLRWRIRRNHKDEMAKNDAEILQKQRDNHVHSVDGADDFWVLHRNDN